MVQFKYLKNELSDLAQSGQYRKLREIESSQGPSAVINGKEVVLFSSNNYLSLANDERINLAAKSAIEKFGYGSGASRLVSGTMSPHLELEDRFAEFFEKESALLFTSGWCANHAIITTLPQKGDIVLLDKMDHASIIDAAKSAPAEFRTYRRDNLEKLERYLQSNDYNRKFIITESIFSMDGDFAKIEDLVKLKKKYDAILIVDEAHSAGCMGDSGKGFCKAKGVLDQVDILVATLGKAFAASGAIVACPEIVREYLINKARGLIYTTAPSPVNSCVAIEALNIITTENQRQEKLWDNANYLRSKLSKLGFDTGTSNSYVIPVIIGEDTKAVEVSQRLLEKGFFAPAIRPPTVPPKTARLRVSVQSGHTKAQIDDFCKALQKIIG